MTRRLVSQEGSHSQYKHPGKKARHDRRAIRSMDLDPKTQNRILKAS